MCVKSTSILAYTDQESVQYSAFFSTSVLCSSILFAAKNKTRHCTYLFRISNLTELLNARICVLFTSIHCGMLDNCHTVLSSAYFCPIIPHVHAHHYFILESGNSNMTSSILLRKRSIAADSRNANM